MMMVVLASLVQVRIVAGLDVLYAMHGAAQTLLVLLSPCGSSVELYALGHGTDKRSETAGEDARLSFYLGFAIGPGWYRGAISGEFLRVLQRPVISPPPRLLRFPLDILKIHPFTPPAAQKDGTTATLAQAGPTHYSKEWQYHHAHGSGESGAGEQQNAWPACCFTCAPLTNACD